MRSAHLFRLTAAVFSGVVAVAPAAAGSGFDGPIGRRGVERDVVVIDQACGPRDGVRSVRRSTPDLVIRVGDRPSERFDRRDAFRRGVQVGRASVIRHGRGVERDRFGHPIGRTGFGHTTSRFGRSHVRASSGISFTFGGDNGFGRVSIGDSGRRHGSVHRNRHGSFGRFSHGNVFHGSRSSHRFGRSSHRYDYGHGRRIGRDRCDSAVVIIR